MKEIKHDSFITTTDNPYDPFTHFDDWYLFDCEKGYFTMNLVNRMIQVHYPNDIEAESNEEILLEIFKRIVSQFTDLYKIIYEDVEIETIDIDNDTDYDNTIAYINV